MTIPKRFALRTLLLLMLVVAAVFGYAQWRSLWLKSQVAELNKVGEAALTMPNSGFASRTTSTLVLTKGFWPRLQNDKASICGKQTGAGRYQFGEREYSASDAKKYLNQLEGRFRSVGVNEVKVVILTPYEDGNGFWLKRVSDVDLLEQPVEPPNRNL